MTTLVCCRDGELLSRPDRSSGVPTSGSWWPGAGGGQYGVRNRLHNSWCTADIQEGDLQEEGKSKGQIFQVTADVGACSLEKPISGSWCQQRAMREHKVTTFSDICLGYRYTWLQGELSSTAQRSPMATVGKPDFMFGVSTIELQCE